MVEHERNTVLILGQVAKKAKCLFLDIRIWVGQEPIFL
jgi:hypothetical protein